MNKFKMITSMLIVFAFIFCIHPIYAEETPKVIIDSLSIDATGFVEATGHIANATSKTDVTCLVTTDNGTNGEIITGENIIWIEQKRVGNNGAFLIEFNIKPIYSNKEATFRFGGTGVEEATVINYTIPELPPDIECVSNNSVLYGTDVYTLDSIYLTAKYVSDSIATGGNIIYFKLGNEWYDLLDPKATGNSYLVPENAETLISMKELPLRYYYVGSKKAEFAATH